MLSFTVSGSFKGMESFLNTAAKANIVSILEACGKEGVAALALHTPEDSGLAAHSWGYEIQASPGQYVISWTNSDVEKGFPVAIMLQYGYGTGTGGYVHGRDYINPALKPIFDKIQDKVWKAVTSG